LVDRFAEGGAGKSETLCIDGSCDGLCGFFLIPFSLFDVTAFRLILCIEGKSNALFIDGGGAEAAIFRPKIFFDKELVERLLFTEDEPPSEGKLSGSKFDRRCVIAKGVEPKYPPFVVVDDGAIDPMAGADRLSPPQDVCCCC